MTTAIIISDDAIGRASRMWDGGHQAGDIARHLGVNPKWFEALRRKHRELFPFRDSRRMNMEFIDLSVHRELKSRNDTMLWQTESGAVVTLPRVSCITCPRVVS